MAKIDVELRQRVVFAVLWKNRYRMGRLGAVDRIAYENVAREVLDGLGLGGDHGE